MNDVFIFDIDGTITPHDERIKIDFKNFFTKWLKNHMSYIVTGIEYKLAVKRLSHEICDALLGIFTSTGYVRKTDEGKPDNALLAALESLHNKSEYTYKSDKKYIEYDKDQSINFSVIGSDASEEARKEYVKWDAEHHEMEDIMKKLNNDFEQYSITIVDGTTFCIAQKYGIKLIAKLIRADNPGAQIKFFGDTGKKGNQNLLTELNRYKEGPEVIAVHIKSPDELLEHLKELDQKRSMY